MNKILDGKAIASQIQGGLAQQIAELPGRKPCLVVILAGNHPASRIYVNRKVKSCAQVGIGFILIELPEIVSEGELLEYIRRFNRDLTVDGILIQLPLPSHINPSIVMQTISPEKDVDGFHPLNVGKMLIGENDGFLPCTPMGIGLLLEYSQVEIQGKHALVIGRSNIVGKPMAVLLMQNRLVGNATVTVANRYTHNLKELCRIADIIIAATGMPRLVTADMVKEGAVVVDVGTNRIEDRTAPQGYRIVGDVDFEPVLKKCSKITPVPGGVGPMTIAMLLSNTWLSYQRRMMSPSSSR